VPPTLVRPAHRTLERGRQSPRKGDGHLFHIRLGQRRDVKPARRVSSITIGPLRPSRALQRHPRRCGSTGRQDATTPAVVCPTASRQPHPRANVRTTTKWEAPTPPPWKPLLDGYTACHDALQAARFSWTAVYPAILCVMPLHVIRIVRHVCKLLLMDKTRIHL
jgi:hypothetical protein